MLNKKTVLITCLVLTVLTHTLTLADESANLCKNGGFETLSPVGNNFPVGWSVSSPTVVIDKDAHSGSIAVRMSATGGRSAVLNSEIMPGRKGKVRFWYKAVSSNTAGDNLRMFVIGTVDGTEAKRIGFAVPSGHVGDGQWHEQTIEFDFSDNMTDGILLAPRVNEQTDGRDGAWLIDDFECISEQIGTKPAIVALYMPEPIMRIGKPAELVIHIQNQGDMPIESSRLVLSIPEGIRTQGGSTGINVETIHPNVSRRYKWQLVGQLQARVDIGVEWTGEGFQVGRSRGAICIGEVEPRKLCTDGEGYWRFMPEPVTLQEGNPAPFSRLKTKKSSALPDSYIGVTAHLPRSKDLETIFEPEHLIDGDYQTSWSGRAHAAAIPGAVDWVDIEFERPQKVREIKLVPYHKAEGFPVDFAVKLRTGSSLANGGKWQTVFEAERPKLPPRTEAGEKTPYSIKLASPIKADALRIEVTKFRVASGFFCDMVATYYLRLSEIEAINAEGENVTSADSGAKIKVPWTFRSWFNSKEAIADTYHLLYDLGVKWNRVGQWGDWTCWAAVEQKKGEYYIDPVMDKAVTESVANGVNILYTLAYGNPLYEETPWLPSPGPVWRHGHPFTGDGGPTKPESIQGFVNYAKFVATHFKGRIKYYEIWNEENSWAWYGSPPSPKAYGTLLRRTAKALKEIDPEIKVCVGGTAALAPTFISESLEQGGGKYLDAVAFHPYGSPYPEIGVGSLDVVDGVQSGKSAEELGFRSYKEMIAYLKKTFAPYNPNFEIWCNEWNAIPKREDSSVGSGSEIREAKIVARWFLMATLTKVRAVWWTLTNQNTIMDWALLRMEDNSPKPSYYVTQTMATLLSGAESDPSIKAVVIGEAPKLWCETLRGRDGEILVAIWSAIGPDNDEHAGARVSLKIQAGHPGRIEAVDTLHGLVQKLNVEQDGDSVVIDGLLVMDYPIILRIGPR